MSLLSFRFFSPLFPRCFSAFAHATCSLSVCGYYLDLALCRAIFPPSIRRTVLIWFAPSSFTYGAVTLYGVAFQQTLVQRKDATPHICHTITSMTFMTVSAGFTHRYYPHRNCFLFLPVLRCFNSRGASLPKLGVLLDPGLSLLAATPGFSQLATELR